MSGEHESEGAGRCRSHSSPRHCPHALRTTPRAHAVRRRRWFTELGDFVILKEHGGMEVR